MSPPPNILTPFATLTTSRIALVWGRHPNLLLSLLVPLHQTQRDLRNLHYLVENLTVKMQTIFKPGMLEVGWDVGGGELGSL